MPLVGKRMHECLDACIHDFKPRNVVPPRRRAAETPSLFPHHSGLSSKPSMALYA